MLNNLMAVKYNDIKIIVNEWIGFMQILSIKYHLLNETKHIYNFFM